MPCKLLIKAVSHPGYTRGCPVDVYDESTPLGNSTGLPNFIRVNITDRDKSDIEPYLEPWPVKYIHTIIENNPEDWKIRVEVATIYISASGTTGPEMKNGMIAFLQSVGGTAITFSNSSVTFTLPKTVDVQSVRSQFADVFDDIFDIRRYYFGNGFVNYVIGEGGEATTDFATLRSYAKDKLAE